MHTAREEEGAREGYKHLSSNYYYYYYYYYYYF